MVPQIVAVERATERSGAWGVGGLFAWFGEGDLTNIIVDMVFGLTRRAVIWSWRKLQKMGYMMTIDYCGLEIRAKVIPGYWATRDEPAEPPTYEIESVTIIDKEAFRDASEGMEVQEFVDEHIDHIYDAFDRACSAPPDED